MHGTAKETGQRSECASMKQHCIKCITGVGSMGRRFGMEISRHICKIPSIVKMEHKPEYKDFRKRSCGPVNHVM